MMIRTEVTMAATHMVHTDKKSKCYRIHGHNWKLEIKIDGEIQEDGMIVDFNDLKELFDIYDHRVWFPDDVTGCEKLDNLKDTLELLGDCVFIDVPVVTCEYMVEHFAEQLFQKFPQLEFVVLTLWESEKSFAKVKRFRYDYE